MLRRLLFLLAFSSFALAAAFSAAPAAAQERIGVLMLHGKHPGSNMDPNFGFMKGNFERRGWVVAFPDMPWSRGRYLETAVMTVIGEKDPLFAFVKRYFADKLPANPKNKYLEVSGGHVDTPRVASDEVIAWIKAAVAP